MKNKILIVEDDESIMDLLKVYLENEGYEILTAEKGKEAFSIIDKESIDIVLLDIMLPDVDGMAVCRYIRKNHTYPVIMVTAKVGDIDKIAGLTMGADDYITKPFNPLEVVARVKAQLRRYKDYGNEPKSENVILHKGVVLNKDSREVELNGEKLALTPTEYAFLLALLENVGRVMSGEELFHSVYKDEYYNKSNNTITVHIRNLREKMKDSFENPKYIKTVWGVGYKIEK